MRNAVCYVIPLLPIFLTTSIGHRRCCQGPIQFWGFYCYESSLKGHGSYPAISTGAPFRLVFLPHSQLKFTECQHQSLLRRLLWKYPKTLFFPLALLILLKRLRMSLVLGITLGCYLLPIIQQAKDELHHSFRIQPPRYRSNLRSYRGNCDKILSNQWQEINMAPRVSESYGFYHIRGRWTKNRSEIPPIFRAFLLTLWLVDIKDHYDGSQGCSTVTRGIIHRFVDKHPGSSKKRRS